MLKLGLIGCGKMGGALLRGVEKALGSSELNVALSDVVPAAVTALQQSLTCSVVTGPPTDVAATSDVVLLAVKLDLDTQHLCFICLLMPCSRHYFSLEPVQ